LRRAHSPWHSHMTVPGCWLSPNRADLSSLTLGLSVWAAYIEQARRKRFSLHNASWNRHNDITTSSVLPFRKSERISIWQRLAQLRHSQQPNGSGAWHYSVLSANLHSRAVRAWRFAVAVCRCEETICCSLRSSQGRGHTSPVLGRTDTSRRLGMLKALVPSPLSFSGC